MKSGAALPSVLLAIALTSAMAVGGAYVARQQASIARFTNRSDVVGPVAEAAVVEAVAGWDSLARAEQVVGSTISLTPPGGSSVAASAWVTRATAKVFWVVVETSDASPPPVRRRVGALVRVTAGHPFLVPDRPWVELP